MKYLILLNRCIYWPKITKINHCSTTIRFLFNAARY